MLFGSVDATKEEAHPHDEKEVGEDATNQGGLHNKNLVLHQSQYRYNELHSITIVALTD